MPKYKIYPVQPMHSAFGISVKALSAFLRTVTKKTTTTPTNTTKTTRTMGKVMETRVQSTEAVMVESPGPSSKTNCTTYQRC